MHEFGIAMAVFFSLFVSVMIGMRLRAMLPDHHLSTETKDAVRLGMASIATMAALVLGLLVTSTKNKYDAEKGEVVQMGAKIVCLDQCLANYGADSAPARQVLRRALQSAVARMWRISPNGTALAEPSEIWAQTLPRSIIDLSPADDAQRAIKAQAASLANDLAQMRWLLFQQSESSISAPLLVIMVFWLALTFMSVGIFAPSNSTVIISQMLAALSISGAVFLILELDQPSSGLVRIANAPFANALSHLAK